MVPLLVRLPAAAVLDLIEIAEAYERRVLHDEALLVRDCALVGHLQTNVLVSTKRFKGYNFILLLILYKQKILSSPS